MTHSTNRDEMVYAAIVATGLLIGNEAREVTRAAIAACEATIRADERERCAKIAEAEPELTEEPPLGIVWTAEHPRAAVHVTKRNIAAAIREPKQ